MPLKLPTVLSVFLVGLFALQGCAQTPLREARHSRGDAPNSIRTLGTDQRFTTIASETVAGRVRSQRAGQPVTILALSGGGADGAFGIDGIRCTCQQRGGSQMLRLGAIALLP